VVETFLVFGFWFLFSALLGARRRGGDERPTSSSKDRKNRSRFARKINLVCI